MRGGSRSVTMPMPLPGLRVAALVFLLGAGAGADGRGHAPAAEQAEGPGELAAAGEPANGPGGCELDGGPQPGARRVVRILAERFSFTPSEIRVPRGVALELRIRSDDTMHGFRIVGGNVNLLVPKRRQGEAVVVFEAAEVGRYEFECSRLCGAGHNFMRGAIVVEDPAEDR